MLSEERRAELVKELMAARRAVGVAGRRDDKEAVKVARAEVDRTKRALGERGPVWWTDDEADLNRRMVVNTTYADWYADLETPKT